MSERRTIVCLSSQRWGDGMWTNKQHIMSRLAVEHDVLYINPASPIMLPRLRPLSGHPYEGVTTLDFFEPKFISRNLPNHHPVAVALNYDLRTRLVARELKRRGIKDAIVWVYHPAYGPRAATIPHQLLVYDCVDEYTEFPDYRSNSAWLSQREQQLCERADLVFTTSKPLYETKKQYNPDHTHLVHNVGDADHFARAADPSTPVPDDIASIPEPIIIFIGAVSGYKLNMEWLTHLAQARPSWNVVVIGPEGVGDKGSDAGALHAMPNVHLLGHRDYQVLPGYLKGADVAVIPYRLNRYTEHCFPIKFFEMLATGKPVVISRLAALEDYYDDVLVADSAATFLERCDEALADKSAHRDARMALAHDNSWAARVSRIMTLIEQRLG